MSKESGEHGQACPQEEGPQKFRCQSRQAAQLLTAAGSSKTQAIPLRTSGRGSPVGYLVLAVGRIAGLGGANHPDLLDLH